MAIKIKFEVEIPIDDALKLQEGFIKASGATQAQMGEMMMEAWTQAASAAFSSAAEAHMKALVAMNPLFATLGKK